MFNKKILITGATGFISSHLTELCVELGYNVKDLDRYNTNNYWGRFENSEFKDGFEEKRVSKVIERVQIPENINYYKPDKYNV